MRGLHLDKSISVADLLSAIEEDATERPRMPSADRPLTIRDIQFSRPAQIDVTCFGDDQPRFVAGLRRRTQVTLSLCATDYTNVAEAFMDATPLEIRHELPDGGVVALKLYVMSMNVEAPCDGICMLEVRGELFDSSVTFGDVSEEPSGIRGINI